MTAPRIDLRVERPVAGGRMLAHHEGRTVFVAGAIPGERVLARVERVSRQLTWAATDEVIEPSPDRRGVTGDPACGGAAYAHIRYPRQLQLKREVIEDAFRRIGRMSLGLAAPVAASPECGYRLRARLRIRDRGAGFFREGTHALCDARPTGQLLPATMDAVDAALVSLSDRLAECDEFVVAENVPATERVIHVLPRDGARLADLRGHVELPPGVTGVTAAARGGAIVLGGSPMVTDTTAGLSGPGVRLPDAVWRRHAASFFQGNRFLIGALVRRVLDACDGDRFVDLYAGVGLFAVALAADGRRGIAVEGDSGSSRDLALNAAPLAARLRTVETTVESAVGLALDPTPDVVVLDPPRAGLSPRALDGVLGWQASRLVYVSCDPPTLARDTARLVGGGYRLEAVEAFDLFPNTPHVEAVAVFARS